MTQSRPVIPAAPVRMSGSPRHIIKVDPLAVLSRYYTLGPENHAVGISIFQGTEALLNPLPGVGFGRFHPPGGEHLVRMMVMMLVVMVMFVVVMRMVMSMLVSVTILMMMFVVMVMMVAAAFGIIALLFAMGGKCRQRSLQGILLLHSFHQLLARKLIPGCRDDHRIRVLLPQQLHRVLKFLFLHIRRTGKNDGSRIFNLIVIKFPKVLHVDLAFGGVRHCDQAANLHILSFRPLHSLGHIAELAHAGGFNQDSVGMILLHHLFQCFPKVSHQRAADASGIHFRDLDSGLLKKSTVDANFAKLVFDQYQLLTAVDLLQQLFDQRGFSCSQEPGKNINLRHRNTFYIFLRNLLRKIFSFYYTTDLQASRGFFRDVLELFTNISPKHAYASTFPGKNEPYTKYPG